jgi:hypothetical protein
MSGSSKMNKAEGLGKISCTLGHARGYIVLLNMMNLGLGFSHPINALVASSCHPLSACGVFLLRQTSNQLK